MHGDCYLRNLKTLLTDSPTALLDNAVNGVSKSEKMEGCRKQYRNMELQNEGGVQAIALTAKIQISWGGRGISIP